MEKFKKVVSDWRGFFVSGGGILMAGFTGLVQLIERELLNTDPRVATTIYYVAGILFVLGLVIQAAQPQIKLNRLENAQPNLCAINAYPERTTFNIYTSDTYEEEDERRRKHAMISTSPYPESSVYGGFTGLPEKSEDHEMIILQIKNENAIGYAGTTAQTSVLLSFYNADGSKEIVGDIEGRWWDEPEKGLFAKDKSTKHLKTTTIAPGTISKLAIASKMVDTNLIYAYNSESHDLNCLRKRDYKLGRKEYYVKVSLSVQSFISPDSIWIKIWSNKDKRLKCNIEIPEWSKNVRHKKQEK